MSGRREDGAMRRWLVAAFCLLSIGAPLLIAQGPNHVFDKRVDFSRYRTYQWVSFPNAMNIGELTEGQLKGTLQVTLATKGLARAQSNAPDLYIACEIVATDPRDTRAFAVTWPDGSRLPGVAGVDGKEVQVRGGDLVLDFYDAEKKQLVWRGVVARPIDLDGKPASRQKQLDRAAEKLLKHYPPD